MALLAGIGAFSHALKVTACKGAVRRFLVAVSSVVEEDVAEGGSHQHQARATTLNVVCQSMLSMHLTSLLLIPRVDSRLEIKDHSKEFQAQI